MDKPSSSSPKKKKTRGVTALLRFIAKLPDGEKYQIDFDPDTFQPIGQYAAKFKSYLSFIARSKVSINEKQWKKISDKLKDVIWDDIMCKFTCPTDKEFRKHWFVYMGERLKQFKTLLSNVYIFGKGDKHGNTTPFEKYKFIKEEDWDLFVQTRQKEDFQEKRLKGKTHASKNIHPHILSRGGYEKLRATVMEERRKKVIEEAKGDESLMVDPPELKRYEAWLMARQKPSGNFTSEATNLVASKIGELVEKNTQGTIVFEGRDDILTVALGINEHPGRIRTAPRGVGFKKFYGKSSRSTLGGVSQDDLLAHLQALEQKMNIDFQHKLQKHLQQQRTELQQQMQKEMQEERAQIQQGMKLLQQMQLELRSERPKEMFIKEHVESVGTSTNGSCSKVMTTEDLTKKMDASEDYLKKINNLKENSFSLDLDHETSELSVFIDRVDLNELTSGIKWLSTSILSLWCTYLHRMCISKNFNKLFGFLDPNRILVHTKPAEVIQTYIQNKLDGEPKKCYLGPLLNSNHWQLFVICPEDNIIFWFCSLNRSPKKNIKVILEGALEGYHLLRGIKKKKPNWKNIMGHQQDNGWACGYYVMKNMFDIIDACIVERFNEIFTDTSSYEKESIDHIRQLWAQFFLQKVEEQEN
ncbi:hypothetical protein KIW84_076955 [Lathyrus oleraceus]|uniref:Ubiquitin-like protease family profile domain-containing protein n=1 Tax=Pisum sativum TaxID=3888 RepID=A0A9D4W0R5_PEA|nr:hypothetical protein KIW84_076955 [Pisum sativum]